MLEHLQRLKTISSLMTLRILPAWRCKSSHWISGSTSTIQRPPWHVVASTSHSINQRSLVTRMAPAIIPRYRPFAQIRLSTSTSTSRVQIQTLTARQGADYLAAQRRNRPSSPHLSIYRPQTNWICGATNRNAAIIITLPVYAFGGAYLFAPLFGWHLDTVSMVEWFGALSWGTRTALKSFFGLPFVFHVLHSLRHLIWDTGAMLTNRQIIVTGWATIIGSVLGTIGLVMW